MSALHRLYIHIVESVYLDWLASGSGTCTRSFHFRPFDDALAPAATTAASDIDGSCQIAMP